MTCLLPTPSVRRRVEAALPCQKSDILSRATRQHVLAIQAGDKMRGPFRRFVSFRIAKQQPPATAYRGVAHTPSSPVRIPRTGAEPMKHLVPISQTASHKAVRFVGTVGSPQSCFGARNQCLGISGRFPAENLVPLGPQSKCFFFYLECRGLMASGARREPWECLKDRISAQRTQALRQRKSR